MELDIIYILCFFVSLIIIILLKTDLKRLNLKIYNEIDDKKIWIKIYSLITIALIHLYCIFIIFFGNYTCETFLYGIPLILIIPYIIFIGDYYFIEETKDNKLSNYTNNMLNYIFTLYIFILVIVMIIPLKYKTKSVLFVKETTIYILDRFEKYLSKSIK